MLVGGPIEIGGKYAGRYALLEHGERTYLADLTLPDKPTYVELPREQLDQALDKILARSASVQPKLDGVLTMLAIMKDGVKALSHRRRKSTGTYEDYTQKLGLKPKPMPDWMVGTVLGGEAVLVDPNTGRPLPVERIAGHLLRKRPRHEDVEKARIMLFDVLRGPESVMSDWKRRRELLKRIYKVLKQKYPGKFMLSEHYPPEKRTAKQLFEQIASGKHPLTREGIVVHRKGRPGGWKIKATNTAEVYIRGFIPIAEGKKKQGVGAILYSLTPDGPIVGKIGSGFTDELRRELAEHPEDYIGRKARIKHQGQNESGAYRHPRLLLIE